MGLRSSLKKLGGTLLGGTVGFLVGGPAGALAGASIGSNVDSARSAERAADKQIQAGKEAQTAQQNMFELARQDRQPYAQFGQQQGLNRLQELLSGKYETAPGYEFIRDEAMRGVNNRLSAMGMSNSGRALKELQDRAAGLAAQDYGQGFNRLYNIAALGSNAAAGQASDAMTQGRSAADIMTQMGNVDAAREAARTNALLNVIQTGAQIYGNRQSTPAPSPTTTMV